MKKTTDPHILAFDMDGTLLNKKNRISFKTLWYLRKLNKQGHHIIIASGRPSRAILKYYHQLRLNSPCICYNGAFVFSPKDKNFKPIGFEFPKSIIIDILSKIKKHTKNVMCETDDEIWITEHNKYLAKYFWYEKMTIHEGKIEDILTKDPMTCIVQTPYEYTECEDIDKALEPYPEISARYWISSPYFELFFKKTSKGNSLKKICEYYNLSTDKLIVFGDSTNDIEMFDVAGLSVLMSNARHDLKEKADMISLRDNNHNGIYYTLKKILKN